MHGQIENNLVKKSTLNTDQFVGCDYNMDLYYFTGTVFTKKTKERELNYSNFLYGDITSIDITNPLKIVVFYRDFNVVVILDSQLNELEVVQIPYDILFASKGAANHIWLFTTNTQTIENYNFKTKTVASKSQPLKNIRAKKLRSTENYAYLQTENGILVFDYLSNYIETKEATNLVDFQISNRKLFTATKDSIFKLSSEKEFIMAPDLESFDNFYMNNKYIYIYQESQLYLFSTEKK